MSTLKLVLLPGDGIGPEVVAEGMRVLDTFREAGLLDYESVTADFGGASIDAHGVPLTSDVIELVKGADAVLLGAVGGPKWDSVEGSLRPERGLLQLRGELGVYANLRPARFFDALRDASPLRPELTDGVSFVTVRELIGGIYFGEPRGVEGDAGDRRGFNTMTYSESEIRRIGRIAFEMAKGRSGKLTSVDKANVLDVQRLWREVMTELSKEYPEVELSHMYVDNCAMQLVTHPKQFDVLVTGNIFGDILSDASAAMTGSLGMLPSASVGEGAGLYEPVHGSAPDIAGQGKANPLATILSVAMLLDHSAKRPELARMVEAAVDQVLADGLRTGDIAAEGDAVVGTKVMGDAIVSALSRQLARKQGAA
ncbi:MAG: 3-isopropylmalate dehydrogenase [Myxococcota bacterium]|nr:3-isopropylmalate dehydrogenase [Myxococcota bacterium]